MGDYQWSVYDSVSGETRYYPESPVYTAQAASKLAAQEMAADVQATYGNDFESSLADPEYSVGSDGVTLPDAFYDLFW